MKVTLGFLAVVMFVLVMWHEQILQNLGDSEFKYKWLLYKKSTQLEEMIKAAQNTPYSGINWCKDCLIMPDREQNYYAWVKIGESYEIVNNPSLEEFIEAAESQGLQSVSLRTYSGGWFPMASPSWYVNENSIHAWMYYGLPPSNRNCDYLEEGVSLEGQCHTHLFGDWYFNKFWRVD